MKSTVFRKFEIVVFHRESDFEVFLAYETLYYRKTWVSPDAPELFSRLWKGEIFCFQRQFPLVHAIFRLIFSVLVNVSQSKRSSHAYWSETRTAADLWFGKGWVAIGKSGIMRGCMGDKPPFEGVSDSLRWFLQKPPKNTPQLKIENASSFFFTLAKLNINYL